jgi:23S rRNA (uracil1939-C5)-methyltransferase
MATPQINETVSLRIDNLGSSGEGIGHYHGYTIFVDGALPGETVEARLYDCQKRYGRAKLLSITTLSPDRVVPPCPLFGRCGGCQLMHLSYEKQLLVKQQKVIDAMQRIGKIEGIQVEPCLPSPSALGYRNKIQLPVRQSEDGLLLGLYARASHDLIEVEQCLIHCDLGEEVFQEVRTILKSSGMEAHSPETGAGELRHVIIKSASKTGEALLVLVTNQPPSPLLQHIADEVRQRCPAVKGVVHNLNAERDNVILGKKYTVLAGEGSIQEVLCGLTFKVSPASFFQVNPSQAECLYAKAVQFADLQGNETVLDAYCGVGTLSLIFAKIAKKVIGVECVPEAIADAQENAKTNQIDNVSFVCANAEEFVTSSGNKALAAVDVVILNPPRKGCEPAFLEGIKRLRPRKVVYISCDPATLARDLALLSTGGYRVDQIQPYDMFPQTAHVECIAICSKRT